MGAKLQAALQRPLAVLVDAALLLAHLGLAVIFLLVRTKNWRVQEGNTFVQKGGIACNANVMCNHQRQEEKIVGNARADTATCWRMPPMLHVALLKLTRRGEQDLFARFARCAVDDGHRVLELVAKTKCSTRLVKRRPAPHPTGKNLVYQPAVHHQIHGWVRGSDLDRLEDAIPQLTDLL